MEARIVVIDNDEGIRRLFTVILKRLGGQVLSYDYAHINLVEVQQLKPDLIILDFSIEENGKGWEFLQLLKMEDSTAKIPIVITTTFASMSAELRDYLLTRYIQVIHKPFDIEPFLEVVCQTLSFANQAGTLSLRDRSFPILVVDDTEDLREILAAVLRLEGYQVVTADNGLVALDAVSRADHCLILLDIAMPIMDGLGFLGAYDRQLRPHTPVIILSGEGNLSSSGLPSFVTEVLPKPVGINHLLRVVEKYAPAV